MAAIETLTRAFGEICAFDEAVNFGARLQRGKLACGGKGSAGGIEQLGKLQLARVQVEPLEPVGQHIDRQDADAQLVFDAQPLGNRTIEVGIGQTQLVGQRLCLRVEIGEMVAPALDLAAHRGDGVCLLCGACARQPVKGAGEGFGGIGGGGDPVLQLQFVEVEIGK